jgi:NADH-quinone oxidoreductase subunit E
MSVRRLAPLEIQPKSFAFTPENEAWVERQIAKYPPGREASAVIPLLWRAQEQAGGWVPQAAIEAVAGRLGMAKIRVLEIATFYTMFNLEPAGQFFIQLCGTTPCMLRGAEGLKDVLRQRIGSERHVSEDGKFSWLEVECLGACCNAPMVQINYDYYEDLTPETFSTLLDDLAAGRPAKIGSQAGRTTSEPEGGLTSLTDAALYDGSMIGAWRRRLEEEQAKKAEAAANPPAEPAKPEPAKAAAPPAPPKSDPAPAKPPEAPAVKAQGEADRNKVPQSPQDPNARPGPANPPTEPKGGPGASAVPSAGPAEAPAKAPIASPVASSGASSVASSSAAPAAPPVSDEHKPEMLAAPKGGSRDDLKLIWGVGPKLEEMLNGMGIYHFDQIAQWNDMNLRWVDQNLGSFRGRAVRDDWIGQSKKLASGWRPERGIGDKPKS